MSGTNRRDFLKGTAWMGVAAALSGCVSAGAKFCEGMAPMGLKTEPLKKVRIGLVGIGGRGVGALHRLIAIPGVEVVALCDLYQDRVDRQQKFLAEKKKPAARSYSGEEGYKAMCESELDLVYVTTPWKLHTPIALYAMEHGKHAAVEVPAATTLEECWAIIETSERTKRHCMQLENCCYGEIEMLALNLARKGMFGELMHAEGAYIHDLREYCYRDDSKGNGGYQGFWRLKWNQQHYGNPYPTHGLLPVMQSLNINRGDRFDYLTCVATNQVGMDAYARAAFGKDSWQAKAHPRRGDMSTTVIRTVNGKTIMVQHDITSPRPYSRINLLSGTRGILSGIERNKDLKMAFAKSALDGAHEFMTNEEANKFADEYMHPLWKDAGKIAQKMGGHGGMDFMMDLRLCYCLQNGLPLDMDVYDLATSCCVMELSERSVLNRGNSQDVPDFTRGAWKTAKPLGIETIDLSKLGLTDVESDNTQLNV